MSKDSILDAGNNRIKEAVVEIQKLINENYKTGFDISGDGECLELVTKECSRDKVCISLHGYILPESIHKLKEVIEEQHAEYPEAQIVLDCEELEILIPGTVGVIKDMLDAGIRLYFTDMNQDCYAALWEAGLDGVVGKHMEIPHYDTEGLRVIGEGANGRVFSVGEELILKTFKNKEPLSNILQERYLTKSAFQAGVPCPISFGLAEVDGKMALLMEMVKSRSMTKAIRADDTCIEKYVDNFVELVKNLHSVKGEHLNSFPRKVQYNRLLSKADKLDEFMDDAHKGKIRKILENIDGEEVLLHGDLQPGNIRVSENGLSFIDLETISTGPEVLDIGALYRSLHCDWEFSGAEYSDFMKLTKQQLIRMWDAFIGAYYRGVPDEEKRRNIYIAEVIGDTMSASQYLKRGQIDQLERAIDRLKELSDMQ